MRKTRTMTQGTVSKQGKVGNDGSLVGFSKYTHEGGVAKDFRAIAMKSVRYRLNEEEEEQEEEEKEGGRRRRRRKRRRKRRRGRRREVNIEDEDEK